MPYMINHNSLGCKQPGLDVKSESHTVTHVMEAKVYIAHLCRGSNSLHTICEGSGVAKGWSQEGTERAEWRKMPPLALLSPTPIFCSLPTCTTYISGKAKQYCM